MLYRRKSVLVYAVVAHDSHGLTCASNAMTVVEMIVLHFDLYSQLQAAAEAGQKFAQKSGTSAGPSAAAPAAQVAPRGPAEQAPAAVKKKGAPMPPMPTAAQQKVHLFFCRFFFFQKDCVCMSPVFCFSP